MMWVPTNEEIAYFQILNQDTDGNVDYYKAMLPLLLEKVNEDYEQQFEPNTLPANVKLFLAQSVKFYGHELGLKSEKMGSVSFSYDFSQLPASISGLLSSYTSKSGAGKVKFYGSR